MKHHVFFGKATVFVLVCIMLFGFFPDSLAAKTSDHPQILRVAFYPLDGFFEYDEQGKETGYGVALLNKISQYTGINFEYVTADSWESTKQMLLDGRADVRMPASIPTTPSMELSYSSSGIIDTYHVMLTLKTRNDLYYQDYDTIRTLKIAISESFYNVSSVKSYLNQIGLTANQLVFCSEYNECREKMMSGEVDALVSNIMDMDDSMKMLMRFNSMSNYFSMTLNNPALGELDDAVAHIKLDEPLFLSELYAQWFPERTVIPFTLEESEYLAAVDTLTFAFRTNEGYLSRYEDGEFYGIYEEQAKAVCEKLGVKYRAVPIDDALSGKISADVYCGFFYNRNFADEYNFDISGPINDINYYVIQKKGEQIDENTCIVAAVDKFYYTRDFLQQKYDAKQFIYFDTYEECLNAVAKGKADIAVINNYIAEYYLEKYQFSDLSARLTNEYSHFYCYATDKENSILASALTKAMSAITNDEMKQLYIKGMERKPESDFLLAFLYKDPLLFTLTAGGLFALLFTVVLMHIFITKSRKQNKMLAAALSAKSDFLARMSHDMRTPLNAVLGFAKLAQDEKEDSVSVQDSIAKIQSSGEYLLGLINDVLDASKIESGKVELHPEVVDGPKFLNEIVEEFKAQGALMDITLVVDMEKADTPYVKMDKLRTRQIYSNLLSNAFKFSPPGSTVEWYMADSCSDETHMEFVTTIRDHGCGMSEEFMQHMFEQFTQENHPETDAIEGTGLGLTIVKKFVELEGGTITVESKKDVGTTFTIYMKREIPSTEEISRIKSDNSEPANYAAVLDGKRVLLCEDHPLNREIAVRQLKKVGVNVESAENGKIGVDMFAASDEYYYDAVLMDVRMPIMNGMDAAQTIRALERGDVKTVPIIAVTANAYSEDVEAALASGMNVHLAKPIDPEILYKTLAELTNHGKDSEIK